MRPGDELLRAGGSSLAGRSRLEAWHVLRALPAGPVRLLLRRRQGKG